MRFVVLLLSTLAVSLSACTGSDSGAGPGGAEPLTAMRHAEVRVGLTEWTIATSRPSVAPGRITILVTNAGATVHDLVVRDSLGSWETPELRPGQQAGLVVRARAHETLDLWCSMPGHRAQGMRTTLSTR